MLHSILVQHYQAYDLAIISRYYHRYDDLAVSTLIVFMLIMFRDIVFISYFLGFEDTTAYE